MAVFFCVLVLTCGRGALLAAAPGDLATIVINLPPHQVVGQPIVGQASLLLLDESGTLLTTYDLAANPITLTCSVGQLQPGTLTDPGLFVGGVINLTSLDIRYLGPSGSVAITASNGGITSTAVLVSFSGYDILGVPGLSADTLANIYSNTVTAVPVRVANGGDLTAIENPSVDAYFASGGGSIQVFFAPHANGREDTVLVNLPTTGLVLGPDTLVLVLESSYRPNGIVVQVGDTLRIPIQVVTGRGMSIVSSSLEPDSVYAQAPFDVSFRVNTGGIQQPWDSAVFVLELVNQTDSVLAVVCSRSVVHDTFNADTLSYSGIEVQLPPSFLPGTYRTRAGYLIYAAGFRFGLQSPYYGELTVLAAPSLTFQTGSLTPTLVSAGREWPFSFGLFLESDAPVSLLQSESFFALRDEDVAYTAAFQVAGNTLYPGLNQISTRQLFVPDELVNHSLNVMAKVAYSHPGSSNWLYTLTDFGGATVQVEAAPLIQVVEAVILAPNSPKVNTGQTFQLKSRVANRSETAMPPFDLRLVTDGSSTFDSITTVPGIPGKGTADVYFNVTASLTANPFEVFRVDIATLNVNRIPPVDNIALVTVQRPAELSVSLILRGADQGYLEVGQGFDLLLGILNTGEADATSGRFRISTNGMDLGLPGGLTVIEEVVSVGSVRGISFVAPAFDTLVNLDIELIQKPLDVNTDQPAFIDDTVFHISLAVTSVDIELEIQALSIPSNVVFPNALSDLAVLRLINPGTSSVSNIRLVSMGLDFFDRGNRPLPVRSVVEVGSTAFEADGHRLTRAVAGGNRLDLLFDDYVVAAGDTVDLVLGTKVLASDYSEFTVRLAAADIKAHFSSSPLEGVPIRVTTGDSAGVVLNEVFTLEPRSLGGSFAVRNNPFDPNQGPAEFRYFLPSADDVSFVVLTLTGEMVFQRDFASGEDGARAGENVVYWSGRNDDGSIVVNGVYLAIIDVRDGRDRASLKLAVMK